MGADWVTDGVFVERLIWMRSGRHRDGSTMTSLRSAVHLVVRRCIHQAFERTGVRGLDADQPSLA
jgi:hypothetical protein